MELWDITQLDNSGSSYGAIVDHVDECVHAQSCPTLCDPMDCSPLGSSVRGILQAGILKWVAVSYSREIFLSQGLKLHLQHWQAGSLPLSPLGGGG